MPRAALRALIASFWLIVWFAGWFESAHGQAVDRRKRTEPGLMIDIAETGARTAACDVLQFTPDGKHLLAAGDDKIVRIWELGPRRELQLVQSLRWPIMREQYGSIYAVALSSDERSVAMAGYGLRSGLVVVVDRKTGKTLHALPKLAVDDFHVVWALAFSPDDRQLAIGMDDGSVWLWDLQNLPRRLGWHDENRKDAAGRRMNNIRLLQFTSSGLLSVAQDGQALVWDVSRPGRRDLWFRFERVPEVFRVAIDKDRKWLAAIGEGAPVPGNPVKHPSFVEVRSLDKGGRFNRYFTLPKQHYPQSLAFAPDGGSPPRLAVGMRKVAPAGFFKELAAPVWIYELQRDEWVYEPGPSSTYRVDALAFHPKDAKLLAVAGGNDHEVRLWDFGNLKQPVSEVRSPGRGLWGVGLSADGKYLGFQDERQENPDHPNRWGKGPWRVFDLEPRRWAREPAAFRPIAPIRELGGWKVEFTDAGTDPNQWKAKVWYAAGPHRERHALELLPDLYHMPRCYTFIPGKPGEPVRLAVGHYWGVSVFELTRQGARRVRVGVGHQGEVMAVAPSPNGDFVLTAGRDQTISALHLRPWTSQAELGASFRLQGDGLWVDTVDPGSPAWEAGLSANDEVVFFSSEGESKVYDPLNEWGPEQIQGFGVKKVGVEECLRILARPEPSRELLFRVKRDGKRLDLMKTLVRQRPVWRFFPTHDGEWVLWRWRDYYYDTSTNGDFLIGWQASRDPGETPTFYRAEQYRKQFHKPTKVAEAIKDPALVLQPVLFEGNPAPTVQITAPEKVTEDFKVTLFAKPLGNASDEPGQRLKEVKLYVGQTRELTWPREGQPLPDPFLVENFPISAKNSLRSGDNELILKCTNEAGARGEHRVTVKYEPPIPPKSNLYVIAVGVGDYSAARLPFNPVPPAVPADKDVDALQRCLAAPQGARKLFQFVEFNPLKNAKATRKELLDKLCAVQCQAGKNDLLILYIGGFATDSELNRLFARDNNEVIEDQLPEDAVYLFCTGDYDLRRPLTKGVCEDDIAPLLLEMKCSTLVLVDVKEPAETRYATPNLVRELTPDAAGPVVLSADRFPLPAALQQRLKEGLFIRAITDALGAKFGDADKNQDKQLDLRELHDYVILNLPKLSQEAGVARANVPQKPDAYFPPGVGVVPIGVQP